MKNKCKVIKKGKGYAVKCGTDISDEMPKREAKIMVGFLNADRLQLKGK